MQKMKTNASFFPLGRNGLAKDDHIYQHGGQHNEISLFPIFFYRNK